MPKVELLPTVLRQMQFHGVDIDEGKGDESVGDCPFCGKDGKFSVNTESTKWQCWSCRKSGNSASFLADIWEASVRQTMEGELEEIKAHRNLYSIETPRAWGCCRSIVNNDWLLPGWSIDGRMTQLYRYVPNTKGKWLVLATPEVGHGLFGVSAADEEAPNVFVCEGPWDGMALWEVMARSRVVEEQGGKRSLRFTGNKDVSLLKESAVVATPGANVWNDHWCSYFSGKIVTLLFDNDYPRKLKDGTVVNGAGVDGMMRLASSLTIAHCPPKEIRFLQWGEEGWSAQWHTGYDVREYLTSDEKDTR